MKYLKKYNESNSNDIEEIFTLNLEDVVDRIDVKEIKALNNFEVSMIIDLSKDELISNMINDLMLLRTTHYGINKSVNSYIEVSDNKKKLLKERGSELILQIIRKLSKKYDFIIWSHRIDIDDSHRPAGSFRTKVTIEFKDTI